MKLPLLLLAVLSTFSTQAQVAQAQTKEIVLFASVCKEVNYLEHLHAKTFKLNKDGQMTSSSKDELVDTMNFEIRRSKVFERDSHLRYALKFDFIKDENVEGSVQMSAPFNSVGGYNFTSGKCEDESDIGSYIVEGMVK